MEKRKIIRVAKEDLDGELPIERALWKIKGVGKNFAHAVRVALGYDSKKKLNELSEKEIKKLEDCIYNPQKYKIPTWLYNRRREIKSGEDKHLIGSNLILKVKSDIDFLKKIRCYRGVRHWSGLPVRGQRTRAHFRKGATVGVKRKK